MDIHQGMYSLADKYGISKLPACTVDMMSTSITMRMSITMDASMLWSVVDFVDHAEVSTSGLKMLV